MVVVLIMIMVVFAFAATHFEMVHICGRRYQYYTRLQSQTGVNLDVLVSTNINVIKIVSGHLFVSSAKSSTTKIRMIIMTITYIMP